MSDSASDVANLRRAADGLMEARRYVRTHPKHVEEEIDRLLMSVHESICPTIFNLEPWFIADGPDFQQEFQPDLHRIEENLRDGLNVLGSDPLVLEGHMYAAARLFQSIAWRIEEGEPS